MTDNHISAGPMVEICDTINIYESNLERFGEMIGIYFDRGFRAESIDDKIVRMHKIDGGIDQQVYLMTSEDKRTLEGIVRIVSGEGQS